MVRLSWGLGRSQQHEVEQQQQQQQQSEPVAVGAKVTSNGPGGSAVCRDQQWDVVRKGIGVAEARSLDHRGASTHPFDRDTPKYSMRSLRPENEPGTVWGGV